MALLHFILMALVLKASHMKTMAEEPTTPSTPDSNCKPEEVNAMNKTADDFMTCIKNILMKEVFDKAITGETLCKNITDIRKYQENVINASRCRIEDEHRVREAFDVLVEMINASIANKDVLQANSINCIKDTQNDLKKCVNESLTGQIGLADNLGTKNSLLVKVYSANFQNVASIDKAATLKTCIYKIWDKKSSLCDVLTKFMDKLFQIAQNKYKEPAKQGTGSVSLFVSPLLMMATSLILL